MKVFLKLVFLLSLISWKLPNNYLNYAQKINSKDKLYTIDIKINDELYHVKNEETIFYTEGDIIKIEGAILNDGKHKPQILNLVGFQKNAASSNDYGATIDTLENSLNPIWKLDGKPNTHAIIASSASKKGGSIVHGFIYLEMMPSKLEFVKIETDLGSKMLRDGEVLTLNSKNQFKVSEIITNLHREDRVTVEIIEKEDHPFSYQVGTKYYEICFQIGKTLFAKIPVLVENAEKTENMGNDKNIKDVKFDATTSR